MYMAMISRLVSHRLVVLVGIIGALAVSASSARAAFPGANGLIAYGVWATPAAVQHEIHTIRPSGTDDRLLAPIPAADPEWSADGRRLAFDRPFDGGIWTSDADGGGATQLVVQDPDWYSARHPKWSPDGQRVAFDVSSDAGGSLRIAGPNGVSNPGIVGRLPEWSPDGTSIAFVGPADRDTGTRAWLKLSQFDGTTRKLARLGNVRSLDFSPDGRKLVFVEDRLNLRADGFYVFVWARLGVVRVADGRVRTLVISRRRYGSHPLAGAWSPDGKRIAYLWAPSSGKRSGTDATQIWTIRPNGSRRRHRYTLTGHRWAESIDWQPRPNAVAPTG